MWMNSDQWCDQQSEWIFIWVAIVAFIFDSHVVPSVESSNMYMPESSIQSKISNFKKIISTVVVVVFLNDNTILTSL